MYGYTIIHITYVCNRYIVHIQHLRILHMPYLLLISATFNRNILSDKKKQIKIRGLSGTPYIQPKAKKNKTRKHGVKLFYSSSKYSWGRHPVTLFQRYFHFSNHLPNSSFEMALSCIVAFPLISSTLLNLVDFSCGSNQK